MSTIILIKPRTQNLISQYWRLLVHQFLKKTNTGKKISIDPAFSVQTLFQGNQIVNEVKKISFYKRILANMFRRNGRIRMN